MLSHAISFLTKVIESTSNLVNSCNELTTNILTKKPSINCRLCCPFSIDGVQRIIGRNLDTIVFHHHCFRMLAAVFLCVESTDASVACFRTDIVIAAIAIHFPVEYDSSILVPDEVNVRLAEKGNCP